MLFFFERERENTRGTQPISTDQILTYKNKIDNNQTGGLLTDQVNYRLVTFMLILFELHCHIVI
jgi:hypothetical protein